MEDRETVKNQLLQQNRCLPVFLDNDVAERHYNGFSNRYNLSSLQH